MSLYEFVAATLGVAYALAGRADEALPLVAGAIEEFRSRQFQPAFIFILLCAGATYLSAGRIDEAACHLGLGKLYGRTGKREQAQEHLTTATTMYRDMGMTYWLEKAEAEMGQLA